MNKPQFVKRKNINIVEIEDDDNNYWEDKIYIIQPPKASAYSTNHKEQKKSKGSLNLEKK